MPEANIRVYCDRAFDSTNLLARVITFTARRVSVLDAQRVHGQERAVGAAPRFLTGRRANLIIKRPLEHTDTMLVGLAPFAPIGVNALPFGMVSMKKIAAGDQF